MARTQAAARKPEKTGPIFVISKTDEGFQVHSPADPSQMYLVSGNADNPHCTCPGFEFLEDTDDPRCEHIDAVFGNRNATPAESSPAANGTGSRRPKNGNGDLSNGRGATMLLKRSVSPDGRIDSLSVEISFPVSQGKIKDLKARAMKTLRLQGEIVQGFLTDARLKPPENDDGDEEYESGNSNGIPDDAEPARMLEVGGINTKWGRRLFIAFQVNGDTLKLFGNRKRLADALIAIGKSKLAERVEEGLKINAPCLVTTKESGQYTNIDEVFPAEKQSAPRGRR
jgi:hypothetical protein